MEHVAPPPITSLSSSDAHTHTSNKHETLVPNSHSSETDGSRVDDAPDPTEYWKAMDESSKEDKHDRHGNPLFVVHSRTQALSSHIC